MFPHHLIDSVDFFKPGWWFYPHRDVFCFKVVSSLFYSAWNIFRTNFGWEAQITSCEHKLKKLNLLVRDWLTRDCWFVNLRSDCFESFFGVSTLYTMLLQCATWQIWQTFGVYYANAYFVFTSVWQDLRPYQCCISVDNCKQLCKRGLVLLEKWLLVRIRVSA